MKRGNDAPRLRQAPAALMALLALAAGTSGVQAQSPAAAPAAPPMATAAPTPVFAIRGFQIDGANPLGPDETARALAPFVRPDATLQTLQQATAALEAALRARGFGLHRVALPPQEVGETVRLNIVQFRIGKVDIEGRQVYDEANVRRALPELQEGASPNFKTLAIQTAINNENPNKQVQVGLRESEEPDRIDATISLREQRPWTFGASLSNAGSVATGEDRFTLTAGHTNLFNLDHQFVGAYTTSIDRPGDVRQVGLSYRAPLYALGGVVGASYTHSDVVGNFGAFSSTGAGSTFGVNYTMYLPPDGGRRSYVTLGLEDKRFDAARINDFVSPGARDRRSVPVTIGYTQRVETDTAFWGYNADFAFNTGWGSDNDIGSYRSEDARIDTVRWKALRGGASYSSAFEKTWLWTARAQAQYSPDPLISGEQFGLGGLGSVRGTELERPISGDSGASATFEVTTPELAAGLRLLGFVDGGMLFNQNATVLKPTMDRIASVGIGLRYAVGVFSVSADYGRLVLGSRVARADNPATPRRGDDRFYINLAVRF